MSDLSPSFECQMIRDEIRSEFGLIANRLSWYVTSQSFLVTAFAISRGIGFNWYSWFSTVLLPALGLISSALIFPSIVGASKTINLWHQRYKRFLEQNPKFQQAFELNRPSWIHTLSLLFPTLIPPLFGLFWIVILTASQF
ncbi:MAG: hypothetical protein ACM3SR_11185 [Ignavibacteriales bacterium]